MSVSKQLLVMRHAKSSWANPGATDFERVLNPRGLRDAPQMGAWVAEQKCVPDLILCSTAARAKETATLFVENCEGVELQQLHFVAEFYHAGPRVYLERLSQIVDPLINSVMVVGHNPGLEELVLRLSGSYEVMSTGAVACLEFEIKEWSELLRPPAPVSMNMWRPKEVLGE